MKKYKKDNPEFSSEIDIVEITDPNHADNINKADKQVFENTLVNRLDIQQLEKNKVDKVDGKQLSANDYTTAEKNKLSGIAEKANNYVHPSTHPATMIQQDSTHRFVSDDEKTSWTSNLQKAKDYADDTYRQSTGYTDQKIANLINGAPETLNTLKEVADAIQDNKTVADALTSAVGKKANKTELDTHVDNNNIHITPTERTNWNDANSKKHSHSNKSVLDGITSALVSTWNTVTNKLDKTGDASNTTTSFTTASARSNISTGEKLSTTLGKIAKFFTDLKNVAFTGSYTDLSNKPTSLPANGGNSATVNGHTVNADVPANAKFTDTNTWRGIQNSLTSDSTTDSLSAAQGKILNDTKLLNKTLDSSKTNIDLDTISETGIYHILGTGTVSNVPVNGNGTLFVDKSVGTPNQIFYRDADLLIAYKRIYNSDAKKWGNWNKLSFSDTNTTYSNGTGIGLSGTTFYNAGVRDVATGNTIGTINVNLNGTIKEIKPKGTDWTKVSGTNCTVYYNAYSVYVAISAQGVNLTEYGSSSKNSTIVVLPTSVVPISSIYLGTISALKSDWTPLDKSVTCNINTNTQGLTLRPAEKLTNVILNYTGIFPRNLFTIK